MGFHFQNAHKMPDFQYPLRTEDGMMNWKERHPSLMKCFKTFFRCKRQMKEVIDSIHKSSMGLSVPFPTPVDSQIAHAQRWHGSSYALRITNGMMCHNERHTLLMKCFKTSTICAWGRKEGFCRDLAPTGGSQYGICHGFSLSKCTQNARFSVPSQYEK